MALRANVFSGVAASHHENALAGEFIGAAKVVRMHDATGKRLDAFEMGYVWRGKVAGSDHDVVEFFRAHLVLDEILDRHGEGACRRVEGNPAHGRIELNVRTHAAL